MTRDLDHDWVTVTQVAPSHSARPGSPQARPIRSRAPRRRARRPPEHPSRARERVGVEMRTARRPLLLHATAEVLVGVQIGRTAGARRRRRRAAPSVTERSSRPPPPHCSSRRNPATTGGAARASAFTILVLSDRTTASATKQRRSAKRHAPLSRELANRAGLWIGTTGTSRGCRRMRGGAWSGSVGECSRKPTEPACSDVRRCSRPSGCGA
jgi:hypothetical protein